MQHKNAGRRQRAIMELEHVIRRSRPYHVAALCRGRCDASPAMAAQRLLYSSRPGSVAARSPWLMQFPLSPSCSACPWGIEAAAAAAAGGWPSEEPDTVTACICEVLSREQRPGQLPVPRGIERIPLAMDTRPTAQHPDKHRTTRAPPPQPPTPTRANRRTYSEKS